MQNDVKLQEGHPVDSNLRPLKIGGKSSSLELADTDNGARVRGDCEITGNIPTVSTNRIVSETSNDGISINSGEILTLNSVSGGFSMSKDGTKFADMYAGMIIGYTDIGLDEGFASLALTALASGYIIPTDEFSVSFVIPPSGNVLIEFQIQYSSGSSGAGTLHAGLSTTNKTAGYTQLEDFHEKRFDDMSARNGIVTVNGSWTLTGLTSGDSEELWIAFASLSTTGSPTLYWGANTSGRYPDFIMKATALPSSITT